MKKQLLISLTSILITTFTYAIDNQIIWNTDNMSSIGGFLVTTYGTPRIIVTDKGNALEFNSTATTAPTTNTGDRIQIKGNPLGTTNGEFTIEMIFKPYTTTTDFAPRIFHICRTDSMSGPRVMTIEIRSTNTWTTDFYIKSVTGSGKTGTTAYPTDQWVHMAMTYKNGVMNGYVNGIQDVSYTGTLYTGLPASAEVSLGGRMNNVNYFKGAIRKLIFTPVALNPNQFTLNDITGQRNTTFSNYQLSQIYPNPVTNNAVISFALAQNEQVTIDIFNYAGQKVQTLLNAVLNKGAQEIKFTKRDLPAGIYFYTITTNSGYHETRKMIIL